MLHQLGAAVQGAALMENGARKRTSESAEAGLSCTRVDGRARKFFIWKRASADASLDFVVAKLSCREDLGISRSVACKY